MSANYNSDLIVNIYGKDGLKEMCEALSYDNAFCIAAQSLENEDTSSVQIVRVRDGFVYYDSSHSPALRAYEEIYPEEWDICSSRQNVIPLSHEISDKPSIYIDVDGTAAYWYKDGKGLSYPEQILDPNFHYYSSLEPHPFVIALAEIMYNRGYDVCILSATDRHCIADRFEWIQTHMPFLPEENIFLCPIGADKTQFCKENADYSLLIDDYNANLETWKGTAVKSVNTVNSPSQEFFNIYTINAEGGGLPYIDFESYLVETADALADFVAELEAKKDTERNDR